MKCAAAFGIQRKGKNKVLSLILCNRISGGAASDKNIKENVCAQIEKNFARAKWKVTRLFSPTVRSSQSCIVFLFEQRLFSESRAGHHHHEETEGT